ncbi:hypothetical protein FCV25MIE_08366, partial [Fagus crenata]
KTRPPTNATPPSGVTTEVALVGGQSILAIPVSVQHRVPLLEDPVKSGLLNSNERSTHIGINPHMASPQGLAQHAITMDGIDPHITGSRVFRIAECYGGIKGGKADFIPMTFNSMGPNKGSSAQGSLRGPRALQPDVTMLHEVHVSRDSNGSNWQQLRCGSEVASPPSPMVGSKRLWKDGEQMEEGDSGSKRLRGGDVEVACNEAEHLGTHPRPLRHILDFREAINRCQLVDMGFIGGQYTWDNFRDDQANVQARLDRALANLPWLECFPSSTIIHGTSSYSDHIPLVVKVAEPGEGHCRPRHFEEKWSSHPECENVIRTAWDHGSSIGSPMFILCEKIKSCRTALYQWSSRTFERE